MILTFAVGPFCTGGGENHCTVTITGGPTSVETRVSRRDIRDLDENDFPPFARVLLALIARTGPANPTKAQVQFLDGKKFLIDVSELT